MEQIDQRRAGVQSAIEQRLTELGGRRVQSLEEVGKNDFCVTLVERVQKGAGLYSLISVAIYAFGSNQNANAFGLFADAPNLNVALSSPANSYICKGDDPSLKNYFQHAKMLGVPGNRFLLEARQCFGRLSDERYEGCRARLATCLLASGQEELAIGVLKNVLAGDRERFMRSEWNPFAFEHMPRAIAPLMSRLPDDYRSVAQALERSLRNHQSFLYDRGISAEAVEAADKQIREQIGKAELGSHETMEKIGEKLKKAHGEAWTMAE